MTWLLYRKSPNIYKSPRTKNQIWHGHQMQNKPAENNSFVFFVLDHAGQYVQSSFPDQAPNPSVEAQS